MMVTVSTARLLHTAPGYEPVPPPRSPIVSKRSKARGAAKNSTQNAGRSAAMSADHHVFERRHVGEEANVLKGSGKSALGDEVGFEPVDPLLLSLGRKLSPSCSAFSTSKKSR